MFPRAVLVPFVILLLYSSVFAQEKFTVVKDLRSEWMSYEDGAYEPLEHMPFTGLNTIYFQLDPSRFAGDLLRVKSADDYFLFINGKVKGQFRGQSEFRIDSLLAEDNRPVWIAIHQDKINERDLVTMVISHGRQPVLAETGNAVRPYSYFRDFVVIAGLVIILLFLVAARVNPKLAADYISISGILTSREADESHASARLTSGSNIQFYVLCSLVVGYYLMIILRHLPAEYALPLRFEAAGFWVMWWRWFELSAFVLLVLSMKLAIIFLLTRLFDMRGMARFHFFNWVRLLLVVLGAATIVLFMYFISRGDDPKNYVGFLFVVIAVLIAWIVMAFFKLSGRSGHSMFHLFSYLCATEIVPLLITVKVLFQ